MLQAPKKWWQDPMYDRFPPLRYPDLRGGLRRIIKCTLCGEKRKIYVGPTKVAATRRLPRFLCEEHQK